VTAAGLALPWVFRALRLGQVFLPMHPPFAVAGAVKAERAGAQNV
jgi:hypothetical protein